MDSSNYEYDREWKKKLPIGFHFMPTDEELNMYLKLKSCGGKIPPGIFTDLDIYQHEPHELPGLAEKHWDDRMYFFTLSRRKHDTGTRLERSTRKGVWKASQARKKLSKNEKLDKQMCESSVHITKKDVIGDDVLIGTKTSLVYWESNKKKTSWLMSEYRFSNKLDPQPVSNGTKDKFELTLNVIYYYGTKKNDDDHDTKKNDDAQIVECNDLIPQPSPITFDHDVATTSTMQPSFPQVNVATTSTTQSIFPQLPQSYTDVATTSTRQQSFPQIPCGVMENVDNDFLKFDPLICQLPYVNIFSSIPQNNDFLQFDPLPYGDMFHPIPPNNDFLEFDPLDQSISQYLDLDNFHCIGDEDIGHVPISQDDRTPSSDSQDQQLKMKKIKI